MDSEVGRVVAELVARLDRLEALLDFLLAAHQRRMMKRNVKDAERQEAAVLLRSWGITTSRSTEGSGGVTTMKGDGDENAKFETRGGK